MNVLQIMKAMSHGDEMKLRKRKEPSIEQRIRSLRKDLYIYFPENIDLIDRLFDYYDLKNLS